jgi:hypothetical protein
MSSLAAEGVIKPSQLTLQWNLVVQLAKYIEIYIILLRGDFYTRKHTHTHTHTNAVVILYEIKYHKLY